MDQCAKLISCNRAESLWSGGCLAVHEDSALPPAQGFAILTCMDARLDPAKYTGLSEGDAHVIRNADGRASDDAIRSLTWWGLRDRRQPLDRGVRALGTRHVRPLLALIPQG